jgi:hypothetical protein
MIEVAVFDHSLRLYDDVESDRWPASSSDDLSQIYEEFLGDYY